VKQVKHMTQRTGRAIFLDRDGTLVHPRHYPSHPKDLRLYDGIGAELRALRRMGFRLVVITNQSGLARGLFTVADLDRMHAYLRERLAAQGAWLDGIYYCPHHPDGVIPGLARRCDCRKPAPGMLLRAADELRLSLADSWLVGDILDDVEAGHRAGCRSVLVDLGTESPPEQPERRPDYIARDTRHALRLIQSIERGGATTDTDYLPLSWRLAGTTSAASMEQPYG
jgi:D-glycero-D-manno-heptose 1,7-bisphosphate phosphatase